MLPLSLLFQSPHLAVISIERVCDVNAEKQMSGFNRSTDIRSLPPSAHSILPVATTAGPTLKVKRWYCVRWIKLNPTTSLLPWQTQNDVLFLHHGPELPHKNNHGAQVGRLLFQTDEYSSGETWNCGKLPPSRPKAKAFPRSLLCIVFSLFPQGLAQPAMKGFLSCFWWRELYFSQISVTQRGPAAFLGYTTIHGRDNWRLVAKKIGITLVLGQLLFMPWQHAAD